MPRASAGTTAAPEPALPPASQHHHWLTQRCSVCKLKSAYPTALSTMVEKHRSTSKNPVDSRLREPCRSLIPQTHPQCTLRRDRNPHSGIRAGQRPKTSETATSGRTLRKFFQQLIPTLSTGAPENCPHPRKSGRKPHKTSPNRPQTPPENRSPAAFPKGSDSGTQQTSGELHLVRGTKAETTRRRSENQRRPQRVQRPLVLCVSGPPAGRVRLSS